MGTIKSFEEIFAWQKARELNKEIYALTSNGSIIKNLGLKDQMRRSSISIMSNIAEGYERKGDKEFARFLTIAKSSSAELKSQLYAALDIGYITMEDFNKSEILINEVSKLIQGFMSYLRNRPTN